MATQPNFDRIGPTDIKLVTHASGNIPPATSVFFSCDDQSYVSAVSQRLSRMVKQNFTPE